MKLIDAHTHISSAEFSEDRAAVLLRALEVCDYIVDIGSGTSPDAFQRACQLAEENPRVYFTAGIHPHDAVKLGKDQKILSEIERLSLHPKCVAIGECGLDYYYKNSEPSSQIEVFEWHKRLALRANLPLMIHTRDAEEDTKEVLKDYSGKAVFHCFTGTQELADFGVQKGFYISFSGIVTFKNAENLREVFLKLPLENILLETDSPFLAPVPMRGKRNESSFIQYTADFLSQLRQIKLEELAQATSRNSLQIFAKIISSA